MATSDRVAKAMALRIEELEARVAELETSLRSALAVDGFEGPASDAARAEAWRVLLNRGKSTQ